MHVLNLFLITASLICLISNLIIALNKEAIIEITSDFTGCLIEKSYKSSCPL